MAPINNIATKLDHLKVKPEDVIVGEDNLVLQLKRSTMAQQDLLLEGFEGLDVSNLLQAARPIFDAFGGGQVGAAIAEHGSALYSQAIAFARKLVSVLLGDISAILLDNRMNHAAVSGEKGPVKGAVAEIDGSRYLGCKEMRDWIRNSIDLPQARYVIERAIDLNGYADLGKAILPLLRFSQPAAQMETDSEPMADVLPMQQPKTKAEEKREVEEAARARFEGKLT